MFSSPVAKKRTKLQMSPFSKPTNQWLTNKQAAKLLGVDTRTIKRWMKQPATREALGGVQHGKQCRIPRPTNLDHWRSDTRWRLKKSGIELIPEWKRDLRKIAKKNSRCFLESCRLWLAAYATVLERGRITQEARDAILLLRQAAFKILAPVPRHKMEVDRLKEQFPARLSELGLSEREVAVVLRYWPEEKHFRQVRAAHTLAELEVIRNRLDYTQAVRHLKHLGQKPTAQNIRPLLHKDMMAHINDTWEQLPGIVVKNPTPEQMRRMTIASVQDQIAGKPPLPFVLDLRTPQEGLARRTVQERHPQKQQTQRDIITGIYRVRATSPSAVEKPHVGKTPIRGSADDGASNYG